MKIIVTSCLALCLIPFIAHAESNEQLRKEIDALKNQNKEILERLDATTSILENQSNNTQYGTGTSKVHIGGYGELHYNQLDSQTGGSDKDEFDFHRFVLTFGYDFTDKISFFSEVELEHALVEDTADGSGPGEVELEQAYIDIKLDNSQNIKTGVFLIPVGIINETHEPTTFYGVERNPVENRIIPATWWEAGVNYTNRFNNGLQLDVGVHSGLNTNAGASYAVRSGRQKVAEARGKDLAYTTRLKWTAVPGLEVAATLQYQEDVTQGLDNTAGSATLLETHVIWQNGPFSLRALYAMWDLDGSGPESVGADEQTGWYIEPSYKFNSKWGIFARYNEWDNQAGDSADSEFSQFDIGLNYWVHPDVVFKIDYQDQDAPTGANELDGFNLGLGYQF